MRAVRLRWLAAVVLMLVATAGIVVSIRLSPSNSSIATVLSYPTAMPSVAGNTQQSSSWFCPGVPARERTVTSEIIVANPTQAPITGLLTLLSSDKPAFSTTLVVPPRTHGIFDATGGGVSSYMSAVVEVDSGEASVEQRIIHPAGDSVALCANQPSDRWFFADGFTGAESLFDILLTNPFPDPTVVNVSFVTIDGKREPASLQGLVIPGQSVLALSMGDQGARNETVLAVSVRASSGRLVAGKLQHFLGRGRLGYVTALGASSTSRQWWFPAGEKSPDNEEQLVVFNPTDVDQSVSVAFLTGSAEAQFREPLVLTVPAGRVTTLSTTRLPAVTNGRYGIFVSSITDDFVTANDDTAEEFVVVEHVVSRTIDKKTGTSVVLGAPAGSPSRIWTAPRGVTSGLAGSLVVANTTSLDTKLRISTIGPAGAVPIEGLEQVSLSSAAVIALEIPQIAQQLQILVESDVEIIVQRELSRGHDLVGRTGVLALPYRVSRATSGAYTQNGK